MSGNNDYFSKMRKWRWTKVYLVFVIRLLLCTPLFLACLALLACLFIFLTALASVVFVSFVSHSSGRASPLLLFGPSLSGSLQGLLVWNGVVLDVAVAGDSEVEATDLLYDDMKANNPTPTLGPSLFPYLLLHLLFSYRDTCSY
jgi:hypothetical protein